MICNNKYKQEYQRKNYYSWKNYFIKKYGKNILCEVCEKQLQWYRKNGTNNTVYFDHKSEGIFIKGIPATWFQGHSCTKENIKKLEKEDLGFVCCRCNQFLPTKNRLHWLKQVTNYILK